ncbi:MAG: flagellar export chaperone FliS [Thermacetogeniaceae bacterium]|jgi:flagellar protein FliS
MYGDSANAYNQYRQIAVTTARPEKLLLMLYDGLVIYLKQAKQAIEQHDPATAHTFLMKGQDIITELMATLKMNYEISTNLYRLYDYMRRRLIAANVRKDAAIIEEILGIATGLRASWAAAAEQVQAGDYRARQA